MNQTQKIAGSVAGTLAGLAGLAYYWLLRRPLPQTQGDLSLPGLTGPVEIFRDRWGVPHIYARTTRDAVFAQGFVHAQDRLWQMDFQRRVAYGRLSEVLGEQTLPVDRWLRVLGLGRSAQAHTALYDDEIQELMAAYGAGVNARMAQGRWPLEFQLLNYTPEPWQPADAIAWFKVINFSLSVNWEMELMRAQLIQRLGAALAAELEPVDERWPRIIPAEVDWSKIGVSALDSADSFRHWLGPTGQQGVGSNNWAVAGSRTASGLPLLANDMHIVLHTPALFYENHLVAADLSATGISLAGVPGIVAGHNERVAWGFTNGFADVQDLFVEHLRETADGGVEVEFRGEWRAAEVRLERIKVRGRTEPEIERVIVTQHGPIINALVPHEMEEPLALRWSSYEPSHVARGSFQMLRARTAQEFHAAMEDFSELVLNAVYADVDGNIGYTLAGRVPVRAQGDGSVPVPGWTGEYEWLGWIPFAHRPHWLNPARGYIATANNRVVGPEYPYHLSVDFLIGDRALRIGELIEAGSNLTAADIQRMHYDVLSPTARAIRPYLAAIISHDPELQAAARLLAEWDGTLSAESPAAALYEACVRHLLYSLLHPKLGPFCERVMGKGPMPQFVEFSFFGQHALVWLQNKLADPHYHWFDLGQGQTRDDVLRLALRAAVDQLKARQGPVIRRWTWGAQHQVVAAHVFGEVKVLDRWLSHGPYPVGGDETTVGAAWGNPHSAERHVSVSAPFRFVADLSNLNRCWGVLLPGNSGLRGSPHYSDQVQAWLEGVYHPMLFAREDVEAGAVNCLRLLPAAHAPSGRVPAPPKPA